MVRSLVMPIVAAACLLAVPLAGRAAAAEEIAAPLVIVTGEARVGAVPDIAEVLAGVTTQGKTAREASEANARTMTAVLAALREAGIAERDLQTQRFTIHPVYARPQDSRNEGPRITGYSVSNQVAIRIRDVARVAEMLDRTIGAGANDIRSVDFSVADPSKALDAARAAAIADARRKAEVYAKAANVQLGRAVTITERDAPARPLVLRAAAPTAGAPPIAAGEETLQVAVTVGFELVR